MGLLVQPSFAAGEVAPSLHGRSDLAKYFTGLKTARNVLVMPQGGVRNRPGTKYIATTKTTAATAKRLIPFVISTDEAFVIELGDYYARFYKGGAQLAATNILVWGTGTAYIAGDFASNGGTTYYCLTTHTAGTFSTDLAAGKWVAQTVYEIPTPWAAADLAALRFAQSVDVLYISHPDYAPRRLTRYADENWAVDFYPFNDGPFLPRNADASKSLTPSIALPGASGSATVANIRSTGSVAPLGEGGGPSYCIEITTSTAHGLTSGDETTVAALATAGSFPTLLNGGTYGVVVINTTVIRLTYLGGGYVTTPTNYGSYTPSAGTITVPPVDATLTANFALFDQDHVGALFELRRTIQNAALTGTLSSATTTSGVQCGSSYSLTTNGDWVGTLLVQISTDGGATYTTIQTLSHGSANDSNFTVTAGSTGADQCLIRLNMSAIASGNCRYTLNSTAFEWVGIVEVTEYTSGTSVKIAIKNPEGLADTNACTEWSEGAWSDYRGWPAAVCLFLDRLAWAATYTEPDRVDFTEVGDYTSFAVSRPLVDSDAFSVVLPSRQLNPIQNMVVMPRFLTVLTSESEWTISPSGDVLGPTTVSVALQGQRGSAAVPPLVIGNEVIAMQRMGTVVRNYVFQLAVEGLESQNISILSQHMFTGYSIAAMAYQQEPDSLAWFVRSDGVLLSLTYLREQEVLAWTRHDTDGDFESACVVPNSTLGIDEVWFIVNRDAGRFVETLRPRDQGTDPDDQWFLDAAVQVSGAGSTITGLAHLNGETVVYALVDGSVQGPFTVADGSITLTTARVSKAVAGLPYVSDVETLYIEGPDQRGPMQGRRVAIPQVKLRFLDSRGGWVRALDEDNDVSGDGTSGFDEVFQTDPADDVGEPMPLRTQDYEQTLNGGYDYRSRLFFRQTYPLPFTLLSIMPEIEVAER